MVIVSQNCVDSTYRSEICWYDTSVFTEQVRSVLFVLHRLPADKKKTTKTKKTDLEYCLQLFSSIHTLKHVSFDTPSQKYAILSPSWLYAVTGIICTATSSFSQVSIHNVVI